MGKTNTTFDRNERDAQLANAQREAYAANSRLAAQNAADAEIRRQAAAEARRR